ncbi:hypothetical protein ACFY8O_16175 [Streptomyces argenteolus]|uniref:AAA domain-containing protein n=1 Tax=Streptomyces argenteolus TaxID=67274 RepID=A0ABW6X6I3_9ACTN
MTSSPHASSNADAHGIVEFRQREQATIPISGIQASGKSTVAQALTERAATLRTAYDGRSRRRHAEAVCAPCECGWQTAAKYPLDWAANGDQALHEADTDLAGPRSDWTARLSVGRDRTVPLPEPLAACWPTSLTS